MELENQLSSPHYALRITHYALPFPHNPPVSSQVFERLASFLTPPHNLVLVPPRAQVRSGAYDNLAAHCLAEAQRPQAHTLWAYQACAQVIKRHSKSFYFSAQLLPAGKREGIMALYAFCRLSDDLVDNTDGGGVRAIAKVRARLALDSWARANSVGAGDRHRVVTPLLNRATTAYSDHPVVVAWADTRSRYGIPQELADELVEGVRMDLTIDRYYTWDDLWLYCYHVAGTVGLMSMYITGTETMAAVPYAVQLGVALQLTNILRDVGEDARAGRIYLPREDMERFGYTEEMLLRGEINSRFVALMDFLIARANALYDAAWPGIAMLPADSRLAVQASGNVYRAILDKIPQAGYDVFNHRAHLSMSEKLRMLPALWWRAKRSR